MKAVRVDSITGFLPLIASVDWQNDIWLYGVILFHILCLANIVIFRQSHLLQTFIFLILLISVYGAEYINEWAAKNYKLFSTEQYFDSNGLFFSVFYSFPALFNCCLVLLFWLYDSGVLMFDTKRQQIERRQKRAKQQQREKTDETSNRRERLRRRQRAVDDDVIGQDDGDVVPDKKTD